MKLLHAGMNLDIALKLTAHLCEMMMMINLIIFDDLMVQWSWIAAVEVQMLKVPLKVFSRNFLELFLEFEETILFFAIDADEDDDNYHNFNSSNCDGNNDKQSSLRIVMVIVCINSIISTCLIVK